MKNQNFQNSFESKGIKLTALEIIEETIEFYSADITRRSIKDNKCAYAGDRGTKCAYSRCWKEGVWKEEYEGSNPFNNKMPRPDELVEERYKGHSAAFWFDLQRLHDDAMFWNQTGLTDAGKKYVEKLKAKCSYYE